MKKSIYLVLIFFIILGCHKSTRDASDPIIHIGNINLTRYEWKKQLSNFKKEYFRRHNTTPPVDSVNLQFDEFKKYGYFLAGANQMGLDTTAEIKLKVLAMSELIMCQRHGEFYNYYVKQKKKKLDYRGTNSEELYQTLTCQKLKESNFLINEKTLETLVKEVKFGPKITIDSLSIQNVLAENLFSYSYKNAIELYSVRKFISYFNTIQPLRRKLHDTTDFISFFKQKVTDDLIYLDAINTGLTKKQSFSFNQINYRNRIIAEEFKNQILFKGLSISPAQGAAYYRTHKMSMIRPTNEIVSIFEFDRIDNALISISALRNLMLQKVISEKTAFSGIKGLQSYILNYKLDYNNNYYEPPIIQRLFVMTDHTISGPIRIGQKIYVFYVNKVIGRQEKTLDEAWPLISNTLLKAKQDSIVTNFLDGAKRKFRLQNFCTEQDFKI